MYKSEYSGKQFAGSPKKVVVQRRLRNYTNPKGKVSVGWEIVKELMIAPEEVSEVYFYPDIISSNFDPNPKPAFQADRSRRRYKGR